MPPGSLPEIQIPFHLSDSPVDGYFYYPHFADEKVEARSYSAARRAQQQALAALSRAEWSLAVPRPPGSSQPALRSALPGLGKLGDAAQLHGFVQRRKNGHEQNLLGFPIAIHTN